MKNALVLGMLATAALLTINQAEAQERLRDGAVGAVGGALIGGPVGLVVGGVGGYVAGPEISRGMRRATAPRRYKRYRHANRRH